MYWAMPDASTCHWQVDLSIYLSIDKTYTKDWFYGYWRYKKRRIEKERERKDMIKGSHYLVIDSISSSTSVIYTNMSNCLNQTKRQEGWTYNLTSDKHLANSL